MKGKVMGKKKKAAPVTQEAEATSATPPEETTAPVEQKKDKPLEQKGILMLRCFSEDPRTGKILTRVHRKVYFPKDANLEPGWYIATILESYPQHGIMDTQKLTDIPYELWNPRYIRSIYVNRNYKDGVLEISPAIPADQLEEQKPIVIHTVTIPQSEQYGGGASIAEIIQAKKEEAAGS
jgi:hypothetical protein